MSNKNKEKKVGYFVKIARSIHIKIAFFVLFLALLVVASPPSDPISFTPINGSSTGDVNVTLSCLGSTDPESDPITYTFYENKSLGINETYTANSGWTTGAVSTYSGTKINTTDCGACYIENVSTGDGDTFTKLFIYTANDSVVGYGEVAHLIYEVDIVPGDDPGVAVVQNNLSTNTSYWFLFNNGDNTTAATSARKDDAGSSCIEEENTIKVCGENSEPLLNMDCNACGNRVQSVFEIQMNINDTVFDTLQNTTANNFNWTELVESTYNWGCLLCDDNAECTDYFDLSFNVAFTRINATFLDEIDNSKWIDMDINVEVFNDEYNINETTTNGSVSLSVPAGNYTVRYIARNTSSSNELELSYERLYDVSLPATTGTLFNLYMLNVTTDNVLNVSGKVISTVNENLEDAIINAQRYDPDTNTYKTTERRRTNFEGETTLFLTTDEFYKFDIEYLSGTSRLVTGKTYVLEDSLTFIIDIETDPTEKFFLTEDIAHTLTFSNTTKQFTFTWNDPNNRISEACLTVYEKEITGDVLRNNSCVSANLGTINVGINRTNLNDTTWLAKTTVKIDDESLLLKTLTQVFGFIDNFGTTGVFLIFILTLAFAFIGIFNPAAALVLTPIPLMFGAITKIVLIPVGIAAAVWLVFIIIAFAIGRKT